MISRDELRKKWIEALRSGKYKQGRNALRPDEDCYCCLGVLCDVSGFGQWGSGLFKSHYLLEHERRFEHYDTGLPSSLRQAVGLTEDHEVLLVNLNDCGDKATFPVIAEKLEQIFEEGEAGE